MKLTSRFLPVILLVAVAAPAAAQPSTTTPGTAAPRGDLSQINGHPIKVGEHNEYYYNFKRRNISANPLGWMIGIVGVSASYAVHDNVVIKGDVTYYDIVDSNDTGVELSAGLPIYFRRAYQGAFLEPGLMWRRWDDNDDYGYGDDEVSVTFGPQALFGWHWTWDSGLNVAAAAGVGRDLVADNDYSGDEIFFNGYFRIGYAF